MELAAFDEKMNTNATKLLCLGGEINLKNAIHLWPKSVVDLLRGIQ